MQQKWCDFRHTCHWQSLAITVHHQVTSLVPTRVRECTRDLGTSPRLSFSVSTQPFFFLKAFVNNFFLILPTIPSRLHFSNPDCPPSPLLQCQLCVQTRCFKRLPQFDPFIFNPPFIPVEAPPHTCPIHTADSSSTLLPPPLS